MTIPLSAPAAASRPGAAAHAPHTVTEALARDHARLDALEQLAFDALAAGDAPAAKRIWDEFAAGLKRHMDIEEEFVFPAFEHHRGLAAASLPTSALRAEHLAIARLLEEVGHAFAGDGPAALPSRVDLHRLLGPHSMQEERMLYPAMDRALTAEEQHTLLERLRLAM